MCAAVCRIRLDWVTLAVIGAFLRESCYLNRTHCDHSRRILSLPHHLTRGSPLRLGPKIFGRYCHLPNQPICGSQLDHYHVYLYIRFLGIVQGAAICYAIIPIFIFQLTRYITVIVVVVSCAALRDG